MSGSPARPRPSSAVMATIAKKANAVPASTCIHTQSRVIPRRVDMAPVAPMPTKSHLSMIYDATGTSSDEAAPAFVLVIFVFLDLQISDAPFYKLLCSCS